VKGTAQYLAGKNPYDSYRGREVIPDDEFKAGPKYSLIPFLKWQSQNLGAGIIWQTSVTERTPETGSWVEKALQAPISSNILGRWFKVSNYGLQEEDKAILKKVEGEKSAERVEQKEIINKHIQEYQSGPKDVKNKIEHENQLISDVLGKDYTTEEANRLRKKFNIGILKGESIPQVNSLISAPDNETKAKLLNGYKQEMEKEEYQKLEALLIKEKVISSDVLTKLQQIKN
jgi:hypothetical protein